MTTRRARLARAAAATAAVFPVPALAHEGEGIGALFHDLLHRFALGPDHGLRPLGVALLACGAVMVLAAAGRAGLLRRTLRTAGSAALLTGLVLSIV